MIINQSSPVFKKKGSSHHTSSILLALLTVSSIAVSFYFWIEFIKLCIWLGQYTFP